MSDELGHDIEGPITEQEREALMWVRDMLAAGRIEHYLDPRTGYGKRTEYTFDMATGGSKFDECGAALCIGGWMYVHMNAREAFEAHKLDRATTNAAANYVSCRTNPALHYLFYPPTYVNGRRLAYEDITPEEGVQALNNVLEHNEPRWNEVFAAREPFDPEGVGHVDA